MPTYYSREELLAEGQVIFKAKGFQAYAKWAKEVASPLLKAMPKPTPPKPKLKQYTFEQIKSGLPGVSDAEASVAMNIMNTSGFSAYTKWAADYAKRNRPPDPPKLIKPTVTVSAPITTIGTIDSEAAKISVNTDRDPIAAAERTRIESEQTATNTFARVSTQPPTYPVTPLAIQAEAERIFKEAGGGQAGFTAVAAFAQNYKNQERLKKERMQEGKRVFDEAGGGSEGFKALSEWTRVQFPQPPRTRVSVVSPTVPQITVQPTPPPTLSASEIMAEGRAVYEAAGGGSAGFKAFAAWARTKGTRYAELLRNSGITEGNIVARQGVDVNVIAERRSEQLRSTLSGLSTSVTLLQREEKETDPVLRWKRNPAAKPTGQISKWKVNEATRVTNPVLRWKRNPAAKSTIPISKWKLSEATKETDPVLRWKRNPAAKPTEQITKWKVNKITKETDPVLRWKRNPAAKPIGQSNVLSRAVFERSEALALGVEYRSLIRFAKALKYAREAPYTLNSAVGKTGINLKRIGKERSLITSSTTVNEFTRRDVYDISDVNRESNKGLVAKKIVKAVAIGNQYSKGEDEYDISDVNRESNKGLKAKKIIKAIAVSNQYSKGENEYDVSDVSRSPNNRLMKKGLVYKQTVQAISTTNQYNKGGDEYDVSDVNRSPDNTLSSKGLVNKKIDQTFAASNQYNKSEDEYGIEDVDRDSDKGLVAKKIIKAVAVSNQYNEGGNEYDISDVNRSPDNTLAKKGLVNKKIERTFAASNKYNKGRDEYDIDDANKDSDKGLVAKKIIKAVAISNKYNKGGDEYGIEDIDRESKKGLRSMRYVPKVTVANQVKANEEQPKEGSNKSIFDRFVDFDGNLFSKPKPTMQSMMSATGGTYDSRNPYDDDVAKDLGLISRSTPSNATQKFENILQPPGAGETGKPVFSQIYTNNPGASDADDPNAPEGRMSSQAAAGPSLRAIQKSAGPNSVKGGENDPNVQKIFDYKDDEEIAKGHRVERGFQQNINVGVGDLSAAVSEIDELQKLAGLFHHGIDQQYFPFLFETENRIGKNGGLRKQVCFLQATLNQLQESYAPNWTSKSFFGRTEKVYTYTETDRVIDIQFVIFANSLRQLQNVYERTNWLAQQTYAQYEAYGQAVNRIGSGPLVRLTIGDMLSRLPGYIRNLSFNWDHSGAGGKWEITRGLRMPVSCQVSLSYQVIHPDMPDRDMNFYWGLATSGKMVGGSNALIPTQETAADSYVGQIQSAIPATAAEAPEYSTLRADINVLGNRG